MRLVHRRKWMLGVAGVFIVAVLTAAHPPFRWGPLGHRIVADLATDRLSPAALAETRRLLGGQSLADVANWADEHRSEMPATAPWHYVDIELMDSSYVPARDCKQDACVVAALTAQAALLSDRSRSDGDRATALKWVVHLVGDLHQPLHGGERGDRGGNDVKVTFQGRPTNLHSLWDSGLLTSYGQSEADIVRQLERDIAQRSDIAAISGGTVVQWVMESHDIARDFVYRNLPPSLDITQQYADAARPFIYDRLLRAGVRLAALIERSLGH